MRNAKNETIKMFCPTCGASNQTADAFCKRCGEWLPNLKTRSRVSFGGDTPQQNIFTGLFMSALSSIVALISAIALYVTYLGTDEAKWSVYLAAGFCLCISAWQLSSFLVGLKLRRRLNRARAVVDSDSHLKAGAPSPALPEADTSNFIKTASVTENNTDLLQPVSHLRERNDRSREDRST
jgi:hypothetical protein